MYRKKALMYRNFDCRFEVSMPKNPYVRSFRQHVFNIYLWTGWVCEFKLFALCNFCVLCHFFVIKLKSSFRITITYRVIVTVCCHILCYFMPALSVKLALYKFNTLTIYPWTGPFVNLKVVSVLCQFSLLSCAKFFD